MENTTDNRIVLAIETAVRGGSMCLLRGESVFGASEGNVDISRAEDLLPNIVEILRYSNVEKNDIEMIAVSNGPGSYTGIRIGIATALGLRSSLNVGCVGISCLEAMAAVCAISENVAAAVPFGKHEFCVQRFSLAGWRPVAISDAGVIDGAGLPNVFADKRGWDIVVHPELYDQFTELADRLDSRVRLVKAVPNIAFVIGVAAQRIPDLPAPQAMYIRNPRFASHVG